MLRVSSIKHIASIISPYNRGEKILLKVLSDLKQKKKAKPIPIFFNALKQLAPGLKVLPQIRAGRTIFLSASLTEKSSRYYAMRWCLNTDNVNLKTPLYQRITADLLDAFQKTGHAYNFKKELNQSVINSRVNAKPVYRGKPKRLLKRIRKQKRLIAVKFRRLRILRTKFKSRIRSRSSAKFKFRYRFKRKFKLKKKKVSLTYLTDYIPPSIKARVRSKKTYIRPKMRWRFKKRRKFRSRRSYRKLYIKKRKKRLLLRKRVKFKLSKNFFKKQISSIINILSYIRKPAKIMKLSNKPTVKKIQKKKISSNKDKNISKTQKNVIKNNIFCYKNKTIDNLQEKAKTTKNVNPDNPSVIRMIKKTIKNNL